VNKTIVALSLSLVAAAGLAVRAYAGTQDFTLVNNTGVDIHNLFVSESAKDDWEEDVLGDQVLADGESVDVNFEGKNACMWDMMVKDEAGAGVYWRKIDLCKASQVTLTCSNKNCSASVE
jgi:hypothetical protein